MPKITPFLWFEGRAEEAARFYTSLFPNSRIDKITYYPEGAPVPKGTVLTVAFEIDGQKVIALNGGPQYKFTPAMSFVIDCDSQAEVDHYWEKLTVDGGSEDMCGWCKDKFGFSWQVIPRILIDLLGGSDVGAAGRATMAMFKMKKIDIAALERARAGN